jgi:hypothetical protein
VPKEPDVVQDVEGGGGVVVTVIGSDTLVDLHDVDDVIVAKIVAVPDFTAVTKPEDETVAMLVSEELQAIIGVEPSLNVAVTVSC